MTTRPAARKSTVTRRHRPEGYTREQSRRGEFSDLLSILPRELADQIKAAKVNGEPLYVRRAPPAG